MDCNTVVKTSQKDLIPNAIPTPADFQLHSLTGQGKMKYQLGGLIITESAFKNLHNLATGSGLSLRLNPGGCSGFKYKYDFTSSPEVDEKIYPLSDALSIYMNDFTFSRSKGALLDFTLGLHGSGLKISNPNMKKSCSCGTSISF